MRRRLMTMLALLTAMVGLWAQNEDVGRQILVFRNTGEVNLFYSNELDSITTNDTAQVFHSVDTTLVVPFAELDSVAVGSRNEIVVNKNVRQLKDETDIPWLIRTEGNSLFYRKDTPVGILPKKGERLYYAEACDLLPYGLAGKVASVTLKDEEYEIVIEDVDLAEIFDKLFYSGRVESRKDADEVNQARRAPADIYKKYIQPIISRGSLFLQNYGEIRVDGETNITADFVVNVRRHFYSARIHGNTEIGLDFTLHSDSNATRTITSPKLNIPLPIIAGVLHPVFFANIFCETTAELRFNYSMKRNYVFDYEWTRNNGENRFESRAPTGDNRQFENEAKMDVLFNGEIYAGGTIGLSLNLVGNRTGVRATVQAGPYLNGELGLEVLTKLREFNPELYPKAEVSGGIRLRIGAAFFHRNRFWIWGEETEHSLYSHDFNLFPGTLSLFPQYERSRAVAQVDTQEKTEVTVATAVAEPTLTPIETGFEIVNSEGEVVDSVFAGIIKSQKEVEVREQFFDSEFVVPDSIKFEELDSFTVRPIFHYAGYTVSAAPVDIIKDPDMQQYTSYQSNGAMAFISSGPFLNIVSQDSTIYTLGSYLPVPPKKRLTDKPFIPIDAGTTITVEKGETLVGTWAGEMDGEQLTLTFEEDGTGSLTPEGESPRPFDYELNAPQTGEILIRFEDGADLILQVQSLNDTTLKVMDKRDDSRTIIIFQRQ